MRTAQKAEGKRFRRRTENFTCPRCQTHNQGDGFTNHCRNCLWSRHVDIYPGDRAAQCNGMMEPVGVETGGDRTVILHRCETCGRQTRCRTSPNDNWEAITALSATATPRRTATR